MAFGIANGGMAAGTVAKAEGRRSRVVTVLLCCKCARCFVPQVTAVDGDERDSDRLVVGSV